MRINEETVRDTLAHSAYRFWSALRHQYGMKFSWVKGLFALMSFVAEYQTYLKQSDNPNFRTSTGYLYPCLIDRTSQTPVEPVYFFQDTWAARKLFALKPGHHFDIGSSAVTLENLSFQYGTILDLPFANDSIECLSSLCVIEHIGLGRYGDPLDSWGSEKAVKELQRVLKPEGNLLISVPVDRECRVYFNAHRTFTRQYIIDLFDTLQLIEEQYIYGMNVQEDYDAERGFGTGLFHFRKPAQDCS
jgi:SAM-dependent methyltransferase